MIEYPDSDVKAQESNNSVVSIEVFESTSSELQIIRDQPECYPVKFEVPLSTFPSTTDAPQCRFWNTTLNEWSTDGCILLEFNNKSAECACTHLSTFTVFLESFETDVQLMTEEHILNATPENVTHSFSDICSFFF